MLAMVALIAALCGGSAADGGPRTVAVAPTLPAALCDLVADLAEADRALVTPDVYDLDARSVAVILAGQRLILRDIATQATGDLRRRLDELLTAQRTIDADMLDTWDADRVELASVHSDNFGSVWSESVRLPDGREVSVARHLDDARVARERLVVGCRAPELAGGPTQQTSERPPRGRLVFYGPGEGLVVADTTGDRLGVLPDLAEASGWEADPGLDAVPGVGDRLVVNARQDGHHGLLEVDVDGTLRGVIARTGVELMCPHWDRTGTMVLATDNRADAANREVVLVDTTGRRTSGPLALPFAAVGCADFVGPDRLVVAHAARTFAEARGIWLVDVDGSDPRLLYRHRSWCASSIGDVDLAGRYLAVHQTCVDPLESGVWVVDARTGERNQIAVGLAGPPKWSPDGSWLVFTLIPIGSAEGAGVWMARADGSQLREVDVGGTAWTPVWLPPE